MSRYWVRSAGMYMDVWVMCRGGGLCRVGIYGFADWERLWGS